MDYSSTTQFGIFDIYRRFCDIKSGKVCPYTEVNKMSIDDSENVKFVREAMCQLSKMVGSRMTTSFLVLEDLQKLMSCLDLMRDSEFSNFYDFVFFMCREDGQKNITVSRAIDAWKLVLSGRFRLLDQWCDFVQENQRHNISEDTWRQVLAFSRSVHEDLEGYDPEGAWPTLIDDFVEHMYRITGSNNCSSHNITCDCKDPEGESSMFEEHLPGLKNLPGLKRKMRQNLLGINVENCSLPSEMMNSIVSCKRRKQQQPQHHKYVRCGENPLANASDEGLHSASVNFCAVGSLSKGFSGLFSSPRVQNQEQRVLYRRV